MCQGDVRGMMGKGQEGEGYHEVWWEGTDKRHKRCSERGRRRTNANQRSDRKEYMDY